MARNKGWTWTVLISLLLGVVGASIFWLYSPYFHDQLAHQVAQDLKAQQISTAAKGGALSLAKIPSQALGTRFQMVADGKEVFLVDMKTGRVWRYFRQTKEGGVGKQDEGFLPMAFYYAGKKHYSASEIEPPPDAPPNPSHADEEAKQPR
jgi:hypothetical protein